MIIYFLAWNKLDREVTLVMVLDYPKSDPEPGISLLQNRVLSALTNVPIVYVERESKKTDLRKKFANVPFAMVGLIKLRWGLWPMKEIQEFKE